MLFMAFAIHFNVEAHIFYPTFRQYVKLWINRIFFRTWKLLIWEDISLQTLGITNEKQTSKMQEVNTIRQQICRFPGFRISTSKDNKSYLHIELLRKKWWKLLAMSSVETVKERHDYLWWIMVASTWFKRRIHQSNSEIKKSTARNWTIWSKLGVVSNMYFKRKKSWKQLLWLLPNESTEGKTKVKCWLGCTEIAKKLREWKCLEILTKCSSLCDTQRIESEKKYKVRSSLNKTEFLYTSLENLRHHKAVASFEPHQCSTIQLQNLRSNINMLRCTVRSERQRKYGGWNGR